MTPKEKTEDLVGRFKIPLIMSDTDAGEEILCTEIAKQCALIAVDEIFFALKYNLDGATSGSVKYWNEVKKEILKL